MDTPPPPTNSSAPPLKTNNPSPNSGRAPAPGAPTSPAAASPPVQPPPPPSSMSNAQSYAVRSVRSVIGELRARGFLTGQEILDAELNEEGASVVFDGVLAAFLAEARPPSAPASLLMPPVLDDGCLVNLLRLYLAVCSRGGFAAVLSWEAVAEEVGFEPSAHAGLKLIYDKYLSLMEHSIRKPRNHEDLEGNSVNESYCSNAKKVKFLSLPMNHATAGLEHLKRKRDVLVEMLNWVRLVAKSPRDHCTIGKNSATHFSLGHMFRRHMFAKDECRKTPYRTTSPQSGLTTEEQTQYDEWDYITRRPSGQADVPEWTGKPSLLDGDPDVLRFLGQLILPLQNSENLDAATIGNGRPDACNCQLPGSIACVRFHVAEKRNSLKRQLGSAFYAMGFDRIGEDAALTWRKDEEKKFNSIIQDSLPSSKYNFWNHLIAGFCSKDIKAIVSYYHNVFQLQRRAYQNRLAPNLVDSDDDSIEPGFIHLRQGGGLDISMSASSGNCRVLRLPEEK